MGNVSVQGQSVASWHNGWVHLPVLSNDVQVWGIIHVNALTIRPNNSKVLFVGTRLIVTDPLPWRTCTLILCVDDDA